MGKRVVLVAFNGEPMCFVHVLLNAQGMIDCVCQACSQKMGALQGVIAQGLPLCKEMKGHPSLARYMDQGYEVITF